MKTFEVQFNETDDLGLFAHSVVSNPAMEAKFLALEKEDLKPTEIKLSEVDNKEHTLLGVALVPDRLILRKDPNTGELFNIKFSKEVIKSAAHKFLKMGYQGNSSLEHETKLDGVYLCEQWIVKDPLNDTANAYGLDKKDIVEGALVIKMKCENEEIYNKALNGEITGISIEGLFDLKEINLKSDIKMVENKTEETVEAVKTGFMAWLSETFKPKEIKEEEVAEVVEAKVETVEEVKEDAKEEINLSEVVSDLTKEFEVKLSETIAAHKVELEKVEEEKKELEVKLTEKKVIHAPKQIAKTYQEMNNLEKMEYNKQNN